MPTYDYLCDHCGPFDAVRRMADRDLPAMCALCGAPSARAWVSAPSLAAMPAHQRHAMATNERASHEPQRSSEYRHPRGCGCCKVGGGGGGGALAGARARLDPSQPKPAKSFANKRPWMISH